MHRVEAFRVAFVPPHYLGPLERDRGWPYFMAQALSRRLDVHVLAPLGGRRLYRFPRTLYRTLRRNVQPDPGRQFSHARAYARQIEDQLRKAPADAVISSDSVASALVAAERRLVLWLDATFENLTEFYPAYVGLPDQALEDGHALEQSALRSAALAIYSSRWAAERARDTYGLPSERVAVVPWGANLERERSDQEVAALIRARTSSQCRLVFIGTDWGRKGGPTAVAATVALNEAGFRSRLTIIGCRPKIDLGARPYVRILGYLDKRDERHTRVFEEELAQAHFLLLPTHADCTPVAIGEAASFGVPTLASAVGGIPELVTDGETGRLFPDHTPPEEYRDAVIAAVSDTSTYRWLAECARERYRAELNWPAAAQAVEALIRERVLA
jgi:glycosyltransferase involved in cell wall biosynthesis